MPSITFGGLSSGLPPNLVDQLIEAERMPIKALQGKKDKSEQKLNLVNDLSDKVSKIKDSISTLASTRGFTDMKLTSGDPNIIQGTVDPNSGVSGNWNIEVVSLAQRASALTNGFPDKDRTEIGTGYFRFETPDGVKEVYIKGASSTLEGAARAINNSHVGVRASVINDRKDKEAPFKLMLSGENVGDDNEINYPTLYFLDGDQDLYFEENRPAQNGVVKVDGVEFDINENTLKDVIPGVTLDLKQAAAGRQVNISVKENQEVVSGKIKEFVDSMNGVLGFIQQQNKLDQNTDTTKTLGGDGMLRSLESRIRRLVQDPQFGVSGSIKRLSQLGIEFNRSGTLEFKEDKFNAVLASHVDDVQAFFVGDGFTTGFITSLKNNINTIMDQTYGPIALKRQGLQDKIKNLDRNIENKEKQLGQKEKSLRNKFAHLEETMSRLKSQAGSLGAISTAAIPSFGSAKVNNNS